MFRKIFSIFFIALLLFFACISHRRTNHGFELYKIQCPEFLFLDHYHIPEGLKHIFDQKFYYLGKGTQSYAFESEDKKYVIKFFRFDRLYPPLWSYFIPSKKKFFIQKMHSRIERLKKACQLAYRKYFHESGLIHIHTSQGELLGKKIEIITPLNKRILVDPSTVCFSIQKKAMGLKKVLKIAKDSTERKKIIHSFFSLFIKRRKNHIVNTDPNLWENFGYTDRVVEFDFGDFVEDGSLILPLKFEFELQKYAQTFRKWIQKTYPELLPYFDSQYQNCLNNHAKEST